MSNEEQAIELVEAARRKLARAAAYVPELSADFAETIRSLEDIAEDLDDLDEEEDDDDDRD